MPVSCSRLRFLYVGATMDPHWWYPSIFPSQGKTSPDIAKCPLRDKTHAFPPLVASSVFQLIFMSSILWLHFPYIHPFYSLVTLVDTCIFNTHSTCVLGKYWVQTLSSRPAGLYILCYMFMAKTCICIDLKKKTPHKREWTTDNTLQMRWESLKKTQIKRTKCGKMNSLT